MQEVLISDLVHEKKNVLKSNHYSTGQGTCQEVNLEAKCKWVRKREKKVKRGGENYKRTNIMKNMLTSERNKKSFYRERKKAKK